MRAPATRRPQSATARTEELFGAQNTAPALPANKDGDRAVGKDLDSLAAKHNSRKAAAPMRGHDDQIAMFVGRGFNDRLIRMIVLHIHDVADYVVFQCHALH